VVANLISGEVQLAAVDAVRLDQALSLMRDWEPKKAGSMMPHPNQWRAVFFQLRPDLANPKAILNPTIRKALAHAIDRAAINDAVYGGSLELADSMISSHSEWADFVKGSTNRYPYDLRRSEQLMADAGYTKVSGTYTSPQDGRFTSELKTNGATDNEQEMTILAAGWRDAGFNVMDAVLPIAQAQDNEVRATFPGMYSNNGPLGEGGMTNQVSTRIPSPENRWNGANRGGWVNRDYDRLLDAYSTTLDRTQRGQLVAQAVGIFTEDLPAISLFFRVQPWIFASSLKGLDHVAAPETLQSWNIHEWELTQ
jgi:ABC-type transport system substrate-binding protein